MAMLHIENYWINSAAIAYLEEIPGGTAIHFAYGDNLKVKVDTQKIASNLEHYIEERSSTKPPAAR